VVGDDHPEHRVAEELQPLVRVVAGVLGAPRPVDERRGQNPGVVEGDAEPLGQLREMWDREGDDGSLRAGRRRSRRRRAPS